MKVSHSKKRRYSILSIEGEITLEQAKAIHGVLTKLFIANKEPLILNIQDIIATQECLDILFESQFIALRTNIDLIIISKIETISVFLNIKEAEQYIISGSPMGPIRDKILLAFSDYLNKKEKILIELKNELENKYIKADKLPEKIKILEKNILGLLADSEAMNKEIESIDPQSIVEDLSGLILELNQKYLNIIKNGKFMVSKFFETGTATE